MPEPDLIELFVQPLIHRNIRFLIGGSVASMLYGEPRVTHDIDLIVFLRPLDIPKLPDAYPQPEFYVPPAEVITVEVNRERRGHFNVIHADSGLKADCYTAGTDPLHHWAMQSARKYKMGTLEIVIAPPEYVILRKLEYLREGGSEKHIRDIRSMLTVSGSDVDQKELGDRIKDLALEPQWNLVLSSRQGL